MVSNYGKLVLIIIIGGWLVIGAWCLMIMIGDWCLMIVLDDWYWTKITKVLHHCGLLILFTKKN